eukprot:02454.XXX_24891_25729_1 [CDS] Oithona nana genome sequencing.
MESSQECYIQVECCSFTDQLLEDPHEEQIKEQQKHDFAKKVAKFQRSECGGDQDDGKLAVKGEDQGYVMNKAKMFDRFAALTEEAKRKASKKRLDYE